MSRIQIGHVKAKMATLCVLVMFISVLFTVYMYIHVFYYHITASLLDNMIVLYCLLLSAIQTPFCHYAVQNRVLLELLRYDRYCSVENNNWCIFVCN
jgi:hypothetical protein